VELKLEETSLSKFGFNVNAGIGLGISSKIFIVLEGRYVLAKQEVSHLLTSSVDKDEKLTIDLGGLTAGFGIKIIL
jgi:opacity protein-like surface antigen